MISTNPSDPKGIVWLASYPKSGNTWIRVFLYAVYNLMIGLPLAEVDLNRLSEFGENERAAVFFEPYLRKPATIAARAEIAAARLKVQADLFERNGGLVLIKTHNALIDDAGFPTINRDVSAGAVYVIRNPLDVAVSFAHFYGLSIDQAIERMGTENYATGSTTEEVYFITGSWTQHVRSWTERPNPAIHVVRYEDLLDRPFESFAGIADHVMMPHGDGVLHKAVDLTSFANLRKAEIAHGFPEKTQHVDLFFRSGRAGQWRDVLTDKQVQRLVDDHGAEMARFGYLPA